MTVDDALREAENWPSLIDNAGEVARTLGEEVRRLREANAERYADVQQIRAALQRKSNEPRCKDCNGELTYNGPIDPNDGIPILTCMLCDLRAEVRRLRKVERKAASLQGEIQNDLVTINAAWHRLMESSDRLAILTRRGWEDEG
jgi:hypothetical protein